MFPDRYRLRLLSCHTSGAGCRAPSLPDRAGTCRQHVACIQGRTEPVLRLLLRGGRPHPFPLPEYKLELFVALRGIRLPVATLKVYLAGLHYFSSRLGFRDEIEDVHSLLCLARPPALPARWPAGCCLAWCFVAVTPTSGLCAARLCWGVAPCECILLKFIDTCFPSPPVGRLGRVFLGFHSHQKWLHSFTLIYGPTPLFRSKHSVHDGLA